MNSYAQEHGYTVVLDGGNQQQPVVLYATPSADITKAVVDAYNVKSGVPAAPARSAPAPTAPKTTPQAKPAAH
jgi:outer membrane protein